MNSLSLDKSLNDLLQLKFGIVGISNLMTEIKRKLLQIAPTDLTVLITGETGTGKEVFANAIHGLSNRKKFPFVSVNCSAIPENLLESELFGNERGAFTGAVEQRKGFFEVANKGTIFLDEIGEMPFGTQSKLLRVLESGEFSRLGSSEIHKVDARIIAATNRELENEVKKGNFRQDLFFRLKNVQLILPPLRTHLDDLPFLVDYYAKRAALKIGIDYQGLSFDAESVLKELPWYGNVRELKNMIETLITLEKVDYINIEVLRKYIPQGLPPAENNPINQDSSLVPFEINDEPKKFELEIIFRTLLELKHDTEGIKRALNALNLKIDTIKENVTDIGSAASKRYSSYEIYEEDEDLNLEEKEKILIIKALEKFNNNRRLASEALGISERTLYRKIADHKLNLKN
jgi:transcriptional regulator with PAS, ATPase and Fis domain